MQMTQKAKLAFLYLLVGALSPICTAHVLSDSCVLNKTENLWPGNDRLEVRHEAFWAKRYSAGTLVVFNKSTRAIQDISLVVEYLDPSGTPILTMPFRAVVGRLTDNLAVEVANVYRMRTAFPPNSFRSIQGTSSTVISSCPARAKVTFIRVVFDDGSVLEDAREEWHQDSAPECVSRPFDGAPLFIDDKSRIGYGLRVFISSAGTVSSIESVDGNPTAVSSPLVKFLRAWKFQPAMRQGKPIDTELLFHVRLIHETETQLNPAHPQWAHRYDTRAHIEVDLVWRGRDPVGWSVIYGDRLLQAQCRQKWTKE